MADWYKLLIKTLSLALKTMFTQRSRDAVTVTWTMRHFCHFTMEHYKVSKSKRYLRKLYLQPIFESLLITCAKNCKNWWTCVKAIASQTWDIFLRHSVEHQRR